MRIDCKIHSNKKKNNKFRLESTRENKTTRTNTMLQKLHIYVKS